MPKRSKEGGREPIKRGLVVSIAGLYEKSRRDLSTNCLHWNGALGNGRPRIWTVDYRTGEKKTLSGALAVYMIAHGAAPVGIPFRRCQTADCVQPAHIVVARDRADMGRLISAYGFAKNWDMSARRNNLRAALERKGVKLLPVDVVLDIRMAPKGVTGRALSKKHGISEKVVSAVRSGRSYQHIQPVKEAA